MDGRPCATCQKAGRAVYYCHRPDCGRQPAELTASMPSHNRYNELLAMAPAMLLWVAELSEQAYALAARQSPGPARELERIARAAGDLVAALTGAHTL